MYKGYTTKVFRKPISDFYEDFIFKYGKLVFLITKQKYYFINFLYMVMFNYLLLFNLLEKFYKSIDRILKTHVIYF